MNLIKFFKGAAYELGTVLGKDALGGKGAGLVEMSQMGVPVPPGFIVPTQASKDYAKLTNPADRQAFVAALMPKVMAEYEALSALLGYAPLVSVRSGAPVSMPGMMDTILNVGLVSSTLDSWDMKLGARARLDSQRRLIQMLGSTAYGVDASKFEKDLADLKHFAAAKEDKDLSAENLEKVVSSFLKIFSDAKGEAFPDSVEAQLRAAVVAVLESWNNERAKTYRKLNNISDDMGTAVVIQAMVFGNANDDSGSGVLFSRNSSNGANEITGEFLPNAQGEDVVAGIRTPLELLKMKDMWPEVLNQLNEQTCALEAHYKDMVDIEFTVENKTLYILQCRVGKRTALAAFQIAYDMVQEGTITKAEAIKRVTKEQYKVTKRPVVDPSFKVEPNAKGLFGSAGVASGKPVFSSQAAVDCSEACILVTEETDPDDIAGMAKAAGVLTATGGQTSHAAVVARSMNKPCVVGASGVVELVMSSNVAKITIDGATGNVWFNVDVPVVDNGANPAVVAVVQWVLDASPSTVYVTDMEALKAPLSKKTVALVNSPDLKNGMYAYANISKCAKKDLVTIDFRPVSSDLIINPGDAPLTNLYVDENANEVAGVDVSKVADSIATNILSKAVQGNNSFAGLTLEGVPTSAIKQSGWKGEGGIVVASVVVDSLADLLDGGVVAVGPNLASKVTQDDIAKVKALLEKSGGTLNTVSAVTAPEPTEYQLYKAMGP